MRDPSTPPDDLGADLPPCLPATLGELDDAQGLLGAVARGDQLGPAPAARLRALVGVLPTKKLAKRWRRSLRSYRDELRGELVDGDD
jgi:hypothetical protein